MAGVSFATSFRIEIRDLSVEECAFDVLWLLLPDSELCGETCAR